MEQKILLRTLDGLRIAAILSILLILSFFFFSFKAEKNFGDIWQQLGISQKDAASNIQESFLGGYLQYASVRNLKNVATGDKAAVTADLLKYTRDYVQSSEFQTAYEKQRKRSRPSEPQKPETEEQIRKKNIDSYTEGLANLEKTMKIADADMKKAMEETKAMLKQQLEEFKNPASEQVKMIYESGVRQYEQRMVEYQQAVKKWEMYFPENANLFVKKRLQQVLDATKDIDYNAQLVERKGIKYFVKPEYEKKNGNWKYGFRAGKEVTETVRAFVKQWMTELN